MGNIVSVKNIIKFYGSKEVGKKVCKWALKYMANKTGTEPYEKLAATIKKLKNGGEADDSDDCDDVEFYYYLKDYSKKHDSDNSFSFGDGVNVKGIDILNPYINENVDVINQQWHLIISFYAYIYASSEDKKFRAKLEQLKNSGKKCPTLKYKFKLEHPVKSIVNDKGKITCWKLNEKFNVQSKALRLWMAEAAGIDIGSKLRELQSGKNTKEIEEEIDEIIDKLDIIIDALDINTFDIPEN